MNFRQLFTLLFVATVTARRMKGSKGTKGSKGAATPVAPADYACVFSEPCYEGYSICFAKGQFDAFAWHHPVNSILLGANVAGLELYSNNTLQETLTTSMDCPFTFDCFNVC